MSKGNYYLSTFRHFTILVRTGLCVGFCTKGEENSYNETFFTAGLWRVYLQQFDCGIGNF